MLTSNAERSLNVVKVVLVIDATLGLGQTETGRRR
jgi:hypothetical protein